VSERMTWEKRISAYDFAVLEMEMYLDTHPYDKLAMDARDAYRCKRNELIEEYEKCFGPYIVTTDDVNGGNCWAWVESPWPWEYRKE
jgi:spore coat protein JB